jgi:magnesium chelatase family protein
MDELLEFKRNVLEVLHQRLEGRMITILRAKFTIEYHSSFIIFDIYKNAYFYLV